MSDDEDKSEIVVANILRAFARGGPGPYDAGELRAALASAGFDDDEITPVIRRWAAGRIALQAGDRFTITPTGAEMIREDLDEGE
jgi:hypothetical protein